MKFSIERSRRNGLLGSSGGAGSSRFLTILGFLALWTVIAESHLVSSLILPSPVRVIGAAQDVGVVLAWHLCATAARVIIGFTLGCLGGLLVGIAMQYNSTVYAALDGIIETFRPIPPVALVPFFVLIFGFAEAGKVLIVVLGTGLVIVVNTVEAIERVPPGAVRWGLVCGLSRRELFRHIILPAAWPEMRVGFRIALATAITLVIVAEFMGATYGLGYLISVSKVTLTTPTILLATSLLGWLGWGLDRIVRLIFDRTCAWDARVKEAVL